MPKVSTVVAILLGVFEFWMVFKSDVLGDMSNLRTLKLFPRSFLYDQQTHILLCAFTLFLGLLRISWAVSGRTIWSWFCVLLTHTIEMITLWKLAMCPHFNTKMLPFKEFVQEVVAFKYDRDSTALLFIVPAIFLFFLFSGPGLSDKKVKNN